MLDDGVVVLLYHRISLTKLPCRQMHLGCCRQPLFSLFGLASAVVVTLGRRSATPVKGRRERRSMSAEGLAMFLLVLLVFKTPAGVPRKVAASEARCTTADEMQSPRFVSCWKPAWER